MDNFDLDWSQKQKLPDGRYVEEAKLNKNNSELFGLSGENKKLLLKSQAMLYQRAMMIGLSKDTLMI